VPAELAASISDEALVAAAHLIRRFHDATTGSALAGEHETVCHHDLSPCNFVFRNNSPVAISDFDAAAPGNRPDDLGYALFLWLNLGTDGPKPREQARRISIFCTAYGIAPDSQIIVAIIQAVVNNIERLKREGRHGDVEWWSAQLDWLRRTRRRLDSPPGRPRVATRNRPAPHPERALEPTAGRCHDPSMIDELRAAADALNRGDPGPFAQLIADECEWRGVPHGHLWWKRTPS
jgi:serine/threonine protein kinase